MDGETHYHFSARNLGAGFLIIGERIAQGRSRLTLITQAVKNNSCRIIGGSISSSLMPLAM